MLNNKINESISEITSDYENFSDFKKGISNNSNACFVYSQVDSSSISNICQNGSDGSKEYMNTMAYGRGIYTVLNLKDCLSYNRCDGLIKYAVKKGAFDNFLIFDSGVKSYLQKHGYLTLHEKISDTVKRLFSKEDVKYLEQFYGENLVELDAQVRNCKMDESSSWNEYDFLQRIRDGEGRIKLRKGFSYSSEKRLDMSNIDGFVYYSLYGMTAIFRTTDLLIPYQYCIKEPNKKWANSNLDFKYCLNNEDDFNNANFQVDTFRRSRKEYPDTKFQEKTICGFSLVRHGNKYNLLNCRTHKYFSPYDFDFCSSFDPLNNTTTCGIVTDEGVLEFKLTTNDFGKNIKMFFREKDNDNTSEWESITYNDFYAAMEEFKGGLNESISEVFTHKDYNTFKKSLSNKNNIFLYRATSPQTAKIEFENGSNREFSGTSGDASLYYGLGVYCALDSISLYCSKYGDGVVKFLLKDGFKDFIIFDDNLRNKYDGGKTVYDEIVNLVPKDLFDKINDNLRHNEYIFPTIKKDLQTNGINAFKNLKKIDDYHRTLGNISNTAKYAKAFIMTLLGKSIKDPIAPAVRDEKLLSKTKIRGIVFTGAADGHVVVVRDFNSLMPIDYSVDRGKTWQVESKKAEISKDNFDKINTNVDPYFLYRNEYEDVSFRAHPNGNFSMVNGKQGYNYKDIWFHRSLLPIDVDSATNFDPINGKAEFTLAGYHFLIISDKDMNLNLMFKNDDSPWEKCPYDEFIQFIEEAKSIGLINKDKNINNNCLLNPNTKRNK